MQVVEIPLLGQGGVARSAGVVRPWRFHNSDRIAIAGWAMLTLLILIQAVVLAEWVQLGWATQDSGGRANWGADEKNPWFF